MFEPNTLRARWQPHRGWHGARTLFVAAFIMALFRTRTDRTQWDVGTTTVNSLTLGVVHEGIAFPLVWMMLDRKGNSNTDERIDLMERFYELFPNIQVRCLTTDREFVGGDWLSYLLLAPDAKSKTPFRMRIRDSEMLSDGHRCLKVRVVCAHLHPGQTQAILL